MSHKLKTKDLPKIGQIRLPPRPWKASGDRNIGFFIRDDEEKLIGHATEYGIAVVMALAPEMYECLRESVEYTCGKCLHGESDTCSPKCKMMIAKGVLARASGVLKA